MIEISQRSCHDSRVRSLPYEVHRIFRLTFTIHKGRVRFNAAGSSASAIQFLRLLQHPATLECGVVIEKFAVRLCAFASM